MEVRASNRKFFEGDTISPRIGTERPDNFLRSHSYRDTVTGILTPEPPGSVHIERNKNEEMLKEGYANSSLF